MFRPFFQMVVSNPCEYPLPHPFKRNCFHRTKKHPFLRYTFFLKKTPSMEYWPHVGQYTSTMEHMGFRKPIFDYQVAFLRSNAPRASSKSTKEWCHMARFDMALKALPKAMRSWGLGWETVDSRPAKWNMTHTYTMYIKHIHIKYISIHIVWLLYLYVWDLHSTIVWMDVSEHFWNRQP